MWVLVGEAACIVWTIPSLITNKDVGGVYSFRKINDSEEEKKVQWKPGDTGPSAARGLRRLTLCKMVSEDERKP